MKHRRLLPVFALLTAVVTGPAVAVAADPPAPAPTALVGGDRDAHGCLASAGYQWCAAEARCERAWELAERKAFAKTPEGFAAYCGTTADVTAMAALLSGRFDNSKQARADDRQHKPPADKHAHIQTEITRVVAPAFGAYAWLWINRSDTPQGPQVSYRIATIEPGARVGEVIMRHYLRMEGAITQDELRALRPASLRRTEGCDYVFVKLGNGYRGRQLTKACRFTWGADDVYTDNVISLTANVLEFVDHKFIVATGRRITGVASGEPFRLQRVRSRK